MALARLYLSASMRHRRRRTSKWAPRRPSSAETSAGLIRNPRFLREGITADVHQWRVGEASDECASTAAWGGCPTSARSQTSDDAMVLGAAC